jgi:hypothetical protein
MALASRFTSGALNYLELEIGSSTISTVRAPRRERLSCTYYVPLPGHLSESGGFGRHETP